MTRSIFDPTGPDTERSGSRNLGPDAGNLSHMPSDVTDGTVSPEEEAEYRAAGLEPPQPPGDIIDMGDEGGKSNPDGSLLPPEDNLSNPGRGARA